jgi:hypothetical protein
VTVLFSFSTHSKVGFAGHGVGTANWGIVAPGAEMVPTVTVLPPATTHSRLVFEAHGWGLPAWIELAEDVWLEAVNNIAESSPNRGIPRAEIDAVLGLNVTVLVTVVSGRDRVSLNA